MSKMQTFGALITGDCVELFGYKYELKDIVANDYYGLVFCFESNDCPPLVIELPTIALNHPVTLV